ncbi:MAG: hypothetical protein U0Y10_06985 [Spirosomataceae bacterium]
MTTTEAITAARAWLAQWQPTLWNNRLNHGQLIAFARQWEAFATALSELTDSTEAADLQQNTQEKLQELLKVALSRMDYLLVNDPDFYHGLERFSFLEQEYQTQRTWAEQTLKRIQQWPQPHQLPRLSISVGDESDRFGKITFFLHDNGSIEVVTQLVGNQQNYQGKLPEGRGAWALVQKLHVALQKYTSQHVPVPGEALYEICIQAQGKPWRFSLWQIEFGKHFGEILTELQQLVSSISETKAVF